MLTQETSPIIYKYVGQDGAAKILANGTLRFSRPSALNDPFDLFPDDLFTIGIEELQRRNTDALMDALESDPARAAKLIGVDLAEVMHISQLIRTAPESDHAAARAFFAAFRFEDHDHGLADLQHTMQAQRLGLIHQFQSSGIFCATQSRDNLLMWAHYADQHRGVVLGLSPDFENDSFLRLTEPVRYSDVRPSFYDLADRWGVELERTLETAREFNRTLVLTKSTHWQYERELRIVIPSEVPDGETASYLRFYPHELTEVHIGCRAGLEFSHKILRVAKALNSEVKIYRAVPERRIFALAFEQIA